MIGETTKVYISRDEDSEFIWIWLKPKKGNWKPEKIDSDVVNYQRQAMDEIDTYCSYHKNDFKKKFGTTIRMKTCKCVHLRKDLILDNEDACSKLFFG